MSAGDIKQRLAAASYEAVSAMAGSSNDAEYNALSDLNDLVEELLSDWSKSDDRATDAEIERAREEYGSDGVNIDEGALASRYDYGLWVQGWVHLAEDVENLCEECDKVATLPQEHLAWCTEFDLDPTEDVTP